MSPLIAPPSREGPPLTTLGGFGPLTRLTVARYREVVADDAEIRRRQRRRADRAIVAGVLLMGSALLVAWLGLAPLLTTAAAILGGVLVSYAVHLAWLLFVNRESDGPPS